MLNINQLPKSEQIELSSEGLCRHHALPEDHLPAYLKEAMKKAGVVRTEDGRFVKK